jgi:hypothetical protein
MRLEGRERTFAAPHTEVCYADFAAVQRYQGKVSFRPKPDLGGRRS